MIKRFWETMEQEYPEQMQQFKDYLQAYYNDNGYLDFMAVDWYEIFLNSPMEYQLGIFIMYEDSKILPPKNSLMITFQGLIQSDFQLWDAKEKAKNEMANMKVVKGEDKGLFGLMEAPPEKPFMPCEKCEDAIMCSFAQECLLTPKNQ